MRDNYIGIPPLAFRGFSFKTAEGEEVSRSIELRRRIYEAELGAPGVDTFDKVARHLIGVTSDGQMVSACRLIGPEERPLEIESFLSLGSVFADSAIPAQLGAFWVRPDIRGIAVGRLLPLGMMRFVLRICASVGVTHLILRTHVTSVRALYRRIGFKERDDLGFTHPAWGPVYVMILDLHWLSLEGEHTHDPILRLLVSDEPEVSSPSV